MPDAPSRPDPGDASGRSIALTVDSRLEAVALLGQAVRAVCLGAGMTAEGAADLELALVEAVNNIIVHGYGRRGGHPVTVELTLLADRIEIGIEDTGHPIPRTALERAHQECPGFDLDCLADLPESGMGLRLIRQSVDRMAYEPGDGGNRLTLVKGLVPGS